jgi:uncharacterized membrane protein YfcA
MKAIVKLFLVLVTVTVACLGWITGQYKSEDFMILVTVLVAITLATFLVLSIHERRQEEKKRKQQKSTTRKKGDKATEKVKRSEVSFALRDKKSGLTWGGGNIKASEATRGTKRKFLGR